MNMRSLRTTGIAAMSNKLAFGYRELIFRKFQFNGPALLLVLLLRHIFFQRRKKTIEMRIQSSEAIWVRDHDALSKPKFFNSYPGNISAGRCIHIQIFSLIGTDIQSHVPVIVSHFAHVGYYGRLDIEWPAKIIFRVPD